jgi:hypothetical protein
VKVRKGLVRVFNYTTERKSISFSAEGEITVRVVMVLLRHDVMGLRKLADGPD